MLEFVTGERTQMNCILSMIENSDEKIKDEVHKKELNILLTQVNKSFSSFSIPSRISSSDFSIIEYTKFIRVLLPIIHSEYLESSTLILAVQGRVL